MSNLDNPTTDNPTAIALSRQKELEELGAPHVVAQAAARLSYATAQANNTLKSKAEQLRDKED